MNIHLRYKYILIDTYKDAADCRIRVLGRVLHALLVVTTQFSISIPDSKSARMWSQISWTKSVTAKYWATLHWHSSTLNFAYMIKLRAAYIFQEKIETCPFSLAAQWFLSFFPPSFFLSHSYPSIAGASILILFSLPVDIGLHHWWQHSHVTGSLL